MFYFLSFDKLCVLFYVFEASGDAEKQNKNKVCACNHYSNTVIFTALLAVEQVTELQVKQFWR